MNNYILESNYNSNGIIQYDYSKSSDYKLFLKGDLLNSKDIKLCYYVDKKGITRKKLSKHLILESSGPLLIHKQLKDIIEKETHFTQFFPVKFSLDNELITDYFAVNIIIKTSCFDLNKSEYKLTNFDSKNPTYRFYFIVLKENCLDEDVEISLSSEMPRYIIINSKIKKALIDSGIKGIRLSRTIDLTPKERSDYIEI